MITDSLNGQASIIAITKPTSEGLLNELSQKGEINPFDSLDTQSDGDVFKRKALVVPQLVNGNVLRYTCTGTLLVVINNTDFPNKGKLWFTYVWEVSSIPVPGF